MGSNGEYRKLAPRGICPSTDVKPPGCLNLYGVQASRYEASLCQSSVTRHGPLRQPHGCRRLHDVSPIDIFLKYWKMCEITEKEFQGQQVKGAGQADWVCRPCTDRGLRPRPQRAHGVKARIYTITGMRSALKSRASL